MDLNLTADQFTIMLIMKGILKTNPKTGEVFKRRDHQSEWKKIVGTVTKDGYRRMMIAYKGFKKNLRTHRIIWLAENGLPDRVGMVVDHINFDKLDNRLENLQLVTNEENSARKPIKEIAMTDIKFDRVEIRRKLDEAVNHMKNVSDDERHKVRLFNCYVAGIALSRYREIYPADYKAVMALFQSQRYAEGLARHESLYEGYEYMLEASRLINNEQVLFAARAITRSVSPCDPRSMVRQVVLQTLLSLGRDTTGEKMENILKLYESIFKPKEESL